MFVETLDELGWMDAASKKKAQEKVGGRPEAQGQGLPPGEGSEGDPHHTHFRVGTARLEVAGSGGDCGQRQDWKPSQGHPQHPRNEQGGHGLGAPSSETRSPSGLCDK